MSSSSFDAAARFLGDIFGVSNENRVYLCTLPNSDAPPGEPGEQHILTYDYDERADAFVRHWDRANRGVYFCVNLLAESATKRAKGTIAELTGLYCDIDFKDVEETQQQVWDAISSLHLAPSKVVRTGHGFHCYWLFQETLPATAPNTAKVEQLLRQLCRHLAGDKSVCEISRLMRLPSSHNTKSGEWTSVDVIIDNPAARYDFMELFEWLRDALPVLTRKASAAPAGAQEAPKTNGHANGHGADNAFLEFAARAGGPPIDVEARLAAMRYQGPGDTAIHITQLTVSASLLSRGHPIDEVVQTIFDATCTAAGAAGNSWSWTQERQNIEQMCRDWLAKHPEIRDREKTGDETLRQQSKWPWRREGDPEVREERKWLVRDLLPESGAGLMAGQWGTFKTFVAFDLAASVMSGKPFVEFPVDRPGGVLFVACEGQSEVLPRLRAVTREKLDGTARVPFLWIEDCPPLLAKSAIGELADMISAGAERLRKEDGIEPVLVIFDTAGKAAGYINAGDENDAVIARNLIKVMTQLAARTKTCVIGIDHFGKVAETGTRGSSGKEADADFVLALLGERDLAGKVTNPRLVVRKRRSGDAGTEYPFKPIVVPVNPDDVLSGTTCIIDWQPTPASALGEARKSRWPKSSVMLRQALTVCLIDQGKMLQPFPDGPAVRAVDLGAVRAEFYRTYPADGDDKQKQETRKKAFQRAIRSVQERALVGIRTIDGVTHVWLVDETEPVAPQG